MARIIVGNVCVLELNAQTHRKLRECPQSYHGNTRGFRTARVFPLFKLTIAARMLISSIFNKTYIMIIYV